MADENIAPALDGLRVNVSDLRTHPENPRRGDVRIIADSLRAFGQVRPIVATVEGVIVAGNHTYRAAVEELGWAEIAAVKVALSETDARRYLLADNRTADFATYDQENLATVLRDLAEQGALGGTGWTPDDLDDLLSELKQIAQTEGERFGGGYAETDEELRRREAIRAAGAVMREVVLMLTPADYEVFGQEVKFLARHYGISQSVPTIVRAVHESYLRAAKVAKRKGDRDG